MRSLEAITRSGAPQGERRDAERERRERLNRLLTRRDLPSLAAAEAGADPVVSPAFVETLLADDESAWERLVEDRLAAPVERRVRTQACLVARRTLRVGRNR